MTAKFHDLTPELDSSCLHIGLGMARYHKTLRRVTGCVARSHTESHTAPPSLSTICSGLHQSAAALRDQGVQFSLTGIRALEHDRYSFEKDESITDEVQCLISSLHRFVYPLNVSSTFTQAGIGTIGTHPFTVNSRCLQPPVNAAPSGLIVSHQTLQYIYFIPSNFKSTYPSPSSAENPHTLNVIPQSIE
jgi:hypothetical protein